MIEDTTLVCIPVGESRDPNHWANEALEGFTLQERIVMVALCLLYQEFPEREGFQRSEISAYTGKVGLLYPHLAQLLNEEHLGVIN